MGYIPYIRREDKGEEIKGNQRDAKNKNPTVYILGRPQWILGKILSWVLYTNLIIFLTKIEVGFIGCERKKRRQK